MIEFIFILLCIPILSMDHTPPLHIPEHLKDRIEVLPEQPIHRTHSAFTIHEIKQAEPGKTETRITIDELKESDGDKDKQLQVTRRWLIISHGATAIVTAIVTSGAAVGIAYAKCHG